MAMRSAPADAVPVSSAAATKKRRTRFLLVALQIVATAALAAAVFYTVDLTRVWQHIREVSVAVILLCLVLSAAQIAVLVGRLFLILKSVARISAWRAALLATLNERVVNQLLPSTLGGDAARVGYLYSATSRIRTSLMTILFDRLSGIAGLGVLCAGAGLLGYLSGLDAPPVQSTSVLAAGALFLGAIGLLVPPSWIVRAAQTPILHRFHDYLVNWARLSRSTTFLLATIVLSIVTQLLFCLIFIILARMLVPSVSILALLVLTPAILITSVVPLTVAGWGLRENASMVVFAFAGIDADAAVAISVLFGAIQLITAIGCWLLATVLVVREKAS